MTPVIRLFGSAIAATALLLAPPLLAQEIDFGDDSSTFANDGQCDDPRFTGEGAAILNSPLDTSRDATDCQAAFEAGTISLAAQTPSPSTGESSSDEPGDEPSAPVPAGEIDFGDDSGTYSNDGECDDPRFGAPFADHAYADATDCEAAHASGGVSYRSELDVTVDDIDFGDDSGAYANDSECDDPRFGASFEDHLRADATDCRTGFEAGDLVYFGEEPASPASPVDFGDDSGEYSLDGECDDPRFTGEGASIGFEDHLYADASDCREALEAGTVAYTGESAGDVAGNFRINFGDDRSASAFDGTCDDPRFQGSGAALELYESNLLADASDCQAAYDAGTVNYQP